MAYDEPLAVRIRRSLGPRAGIAEKKMFGGLAFQLDGKMFCGIAKDDFMVRVGPDGYERALAEPHVRPMDFTGRPMNGYVFVSPAGCSTEQAVKIWVERSIEFVTTLGRKPAKRKRVRTHVVPSTSVEGTALTCNHVTPAARRLDVVKFREVGRCRSVW